MGYSKEVRQKALQIIQDRRMNAEKEAERRHEKIYADVPQAKEYERQIASCGIRAGKAVLKGGDVKEEIRKLKESSMRLQQEYAALLEEAGYSVSDTEPDYYCKKCNDRGFVEKENRTLTCSCLRQAMVETACRELNKNSPLSLCTFDDFSLDYYSKNVMQGMPRSSYEQMTNILSFCKDYAASFSQNSGSIFMNGMTGLGKTHLSLAIANEVIKKGYGVIYASAPTIVSQIENEHFNRKKSEEPPIEQTLQECDLLIIDDLGTEFNNKFTTPAIYNVFNARIVAKKPFIVSTNLKLSELREIYTDRLVSRFIGEAKRLDFFGEDIRIKKSREG